MLTSPPPRRALSPLCDPSQIAALGMGVLCTLALHEEARPALIDVPAFCLYAFAAHGDVVSQGLLQLLHACCRVTMSGNTPMLRCGCASAS